MIPGLNFVVNDKKTSKSKKKINMALKEKTQKELEEKIEKLENLIAEKGVGSDYLSRAERVQRDLNLALILGVTTAVLGVTAWTIYHYKD